MATTGTTPPQRPSQPTQAQIDATAQHVNNAAASLSDQQARQNANRQVASGDAQQDRIKAAVSQQQAINSARQTELREGDHAVIDLGKVNETQQTGWIRTELRRLHQAGAHLAAGRVRRIESTPNGRVAEVETMDGRSVQRVPEAMVTRADLYQSEKEQNGSHGQ